MIKAKLLVGLVYCIQILILLPCVICYRGYGRHEESRRKVPHHKGECLAETKVPWSYRGNNGPEFWGRIFFTCNGDEQSPIAISTKHTIYDPKLGKLAMENYDIPIKRATIENNGRTVEVTPRDGVERSILVHGSTYRLEQLHFHWGDSYYRGAEHTLDGIQYAMEMHLVHQNANEKIAVVAVFFKEQNRKNNELQHIIRAFPNVMYNDTSSELKSHLKLDNLVPANPSSFYRYEGSLTTPTCAQGVTWSVLTRPLYVSKNQMAEFRRLYTVKKSDANSRCKMVNNFRPVQPLNDRVVYYSQ